MSKGPSYCHINYKSGKKRHNRWQWYSLSHPLLYCTLHESGTRKALLGPWLSMEIYWFP